MLGAGFYIPRYYRTPSSNEVDDFSPDINDEKITFHLDNDLLANNNDGPYYYQDGIAINPLDEKGDLVENGMVAIPSSDEMVTISMKSADPRMVYGLRNGQDVNGASRGVNYTRLLAIFCVTHAQKYKLSDIIKTYNFECLRNRFPLKANIEFPLTNIKSMDKLQAYCKSLGQENDFRVALLRRPIREIKFSSKLSIVDTKYEMKDFTHAFVYGWRLLGTMGGIREVNNTSDSHKKTLNVGVSTTLADSAANIAASTAATKSALRKISNSEAKRLLRNLPRSLILKALGEAGADMTASAVTKLWSDQESGTSDLGANAKRLPRKSASNFADVITNADFLLPYYVDGSAALDGEVSLEYVQDEMKNVSQSETEPRTGTFNFDACRLPTLNSMEAATVPIAELEKIRINYHLIQYETKLVLRSQWIKNRENNATKDDADGFVEVTTNLLTSGERGSIPDFDMDHRKTRKLKNCCPYPMADERENLEMVETLKSKQLMRKNQELDYIYVHRLVDEISKLVTIDPVSFSRDMLDTPKAKGRAYCFADALKSGVADSKCYANIMTVACRVNGIPSRLVYSYPIMKPVTVGIGSSSATSGKASGDAGDGRNSPPINLHDTHHGCEVWISNAGWVLLEPQNGRLGCYSDFLPVSHNNDKNCDSGVRWDAKLLGSQCPGSLSLRTNADKLVKSAFKKYDTDASGALDSNELRSILADWYVETVHNFQIWNAEDLEIFNSVAKSAQLKWQIQNKEFGRSKISNYLLDQVRMELFRKPREISLEDRESGAFPRRQRPPAVEPGSGMPTSKSWTKRGSRDGSTISRGGVDDNLLSSSDDEEISDDERSDLDFENEPTRLCEVGKPVHFSANCLYRTVRRMGIASPLAWRFGYLAPKDGTSAGCILLQEKPESDSTKWMVKVPSEQFGVTHEKRAKLLARKQNVKIRIWNDLVIPVRICYLDEQGNYSIEPERNSRIRPGEEFNGDSEFGMAYGLFEDLGNDHNSHRALRDSDHRLSSPPGGDADCLRLDPKKVYNTTRDAAFLDHLELACVSFNIDCAELQTPFEVSGAMILCGNQERLASIFIDPRVDVAPGSLRFHQDMSKYKRMEILPDQAKKASLMNAIRTTPLKMFNKKTDDASTETSSFNRTLIGGGAASKTTSASTEESILTKWDLKTIQNTKQGVVNQVYEKIQIFDLDPRTGLRKTIQSDSITVPVVRGYQGPDSVPDLIVVKNNTVKSNAKLRSAMPSILPVTLDGMHLHSMDLGCSLYPVIGEETATKSKSKMASILTRPGMNSLGRGSSASSAFSSMAGINASANAAGIGTRSVSQLDPSMLQPGISNLRHQTSVTARTTSNVNVDVIPEGNTARNTELLTKIAAKASNLHHVDPTLLRDRSPHSALGKRRAFGQSKDIGMDEGKSSFPEGAKKATTMSCGISTTSTASAKSAANKKKAIFAANKSKAPSKAGTPKTTSPTTPCQRAFSAGEAKPVKKKKARGDSTSQGDDLDLVSTLTPQSGRFDSTSAIPDLGVVRADNEDHVYNSMSVEEGAPDSRKKSHLEGDGLINLDALDIDDDDSDDLFKYKFPSLQMKSEVFDLVSSDPDDSEDDDAANRKAGKGKPKAGTTAKGKKAAGTTKPKIDKEVRRWKKDDADVEFTFDNVKVNRKARIKEGIEILYKGQTRPVGEAHGIPETWNPAGDGLNLAGGDKKGDKDDLKKKQKKEKLKAFQKPTAAYAMRVETGKALRGQMENVDAKSIAQNWEKKGVKLGELGANQLEYLQYHQNLGFREEYECGVNAKFELNLAKRNLPYLIKNVKEPVVNESYLVKTGRNLNNLKTDNKPVKGAANGLLSYQEKKTADVVSEAYDYAPPARRASAAEAEIDGEEDAMSDGEGDCDKPSSTATSDTVRLGTTLLIHGEPYIIRAIHKGGTTTSMEMSPVLDLADHEVMHDALEKLAREKLTKRIGEDGKPTVFLDESTRKDIKIMKSNLKDQVRDSYDLFCDYEKDQRNIAEFERLMAAGEFVDIEEMCNLDIGAHDEARNWNHKKTIDIEDVARENGLALIGNHEELALVDHARSTDGNYGGLSMGGDGKGVHIVVEENKDAHLLKAPHAIAEAVADGKKKTRRISRATRMTLENARSSNVKRYLWRGGTHWELSDHPAGAAAQREDEESSICWIDVTPLSKKVIMLTAGEFGTYRHSAARNGTTSDSVAPNAVATTSRDRTGGGVGDGDEDDDVYVPPVEFHRLETITGQMLWEHEDWKAHGWTKDPESGIWLNDGRTSDLANREVDSKPGQSDKKDKHRADSDDFWSEEKTFWYWDVPSDSWREWDWSWDNETAWDNIGQEELRANKVSMLKQSAYKAHTSAHGYGAHAEVSDMDVSWFSHVGDDDQAKAASDEKGRETSIAKRSQIAKEIQIAMNEEKEHWEKTGRVWVDGYYRKNWSWCQGYWAYITDWVDDFADDPSPELLYAWHSFNYADKGPDDLVKNITFSELKRDKKRRLLCMERSIQRKRKGKGGKERGSDGKVGGKGGKAKRISKGKVGVPDLQPVVELKPKFCKDRGCCLGLC